MTRGPASTRSTCSRTPRATCTWVTPRRSAAATSIARFRWMQGHNVLHPIGWDSFGLPAENAAIKRGHPSEGMDLREHRAAGRFVQADGDVVRLDAAAPHARDPEYYRWTQWLFLKLFEHGPRVPEERAGELVSQRSDGARQRAGDQRALRAMRHRGRPEGPHAVVLQDHRLRAASARRRGHARGVARARDHDAAELDRALRGRHGRVHRRGDGRRGRGVHDAARTRSGASRSSCSRPSIRWSRSWRGPAGRRRPLASWSIACRPRRSRTASRPRAARACRSASTS